MPLSVTCSCGKRFRVRDELAGKKVKCPECGESISVPRGADDEEELAGLLPPSRKSPRKSKPSKKPSSAMKAILIGFGVIVLMLVAYESGVWIWFRSGFIRV